MIRKGQAPRARREDILLGKPRRILLKEAALAGMAMA
jgi:hypothetical protein